MKAQAESARAVRLRVEDTVAVLIQGVRRGQAVSVIGPGSPLLVTAAEDIPGYHKIALCDFPVGQKPLRNGIPIGIARSAIQAGTWVHTHNLASAYARLTEGSDV